MMDGFFYSLLRTTFCTSLAAGLATVLLNDKHRLVSPAIHRLIWSLVLAQGWAYFPIALALPVFFSELPSAAVSLTTVERQASSAYVVVSGVSADVISEKTTRSMVSPSTWLMIAWLAGMIAIAWHYIRQYRALIANVPLGREPNKPQWIEEWNRISRDVGVGSCTQFRLSDDLGPLCCFVPYFYLVVAPERLWSSLDTWQRECVLRHELAHIVRRDLWKSVLIRVLALPQWFNPIAWKAVREFDAAGEWACDDFVMNHCGRNTLSSYPATLLQIVEHSSTTTPGSLAAHGGQLNARIRRLIQPRFKEENNMKKVLISILLFGIFLCQSIRLVAVETADSPSAIENRKSDETNEQFSVAANEQIAESRESLLKRTGLVPYCVEPPDVLGMIITSPNGQRTVEEHVVSPDGSISLGSMGSVDVVGKTIDEITDMVNARLTKNKSQERVAFDVKAYNSKVYYIVVKSDTSRDNVFRFIVTGNDTVLDAFAQAGNLGQLSCKHIWIARPNAKKGAADTILSVDWRAIVEGGDVTTNHALYPGDRIFLAESGPDDTVTSTNAYSTNLASVPVLAAATPPTVRQVLVECELLEISTDDTLSLRTLISASVADANAYVCVIDQQAVEALKRELSKRGTLTTISVPKVVTISGRRVNMAFGGETEIMVSQEGERPDRAERLKLGTMVDITPSLLDDGRLRMDFAMRVRQADMSGSVLVGAQKVPGLRVSFVSETVDMKIGEKVVALSRRTLPPTGNGNRYVLAIVRAEVVRELEFPGQETPVNVFERTKDGGAKRE